MIFAVSRLADGRTLRSEVRRANRRLIDCRSTSWAVDWGHGRPAASREAGALDPNLKAMLAEADKDDIVSALVYLWDQVDVDELTREIDEANGSFSFRHDLVVRSLQNMERRLIPHC